MAKDTIVEVDEYYPRLIESRLKRLLRDEPLIIVRGPRASGKSTLLRRIVENKQGTSIDLDRPDDLALLIDEPERVLSMRAPVLIDEYQRYPEILRTIRGWVDTVGTPGQFLICGSVTADALPIGTETLTGRSHTEHLWPLSQSELVGVATSFVDRALDDPASVLGEGQTSRDGYLAIATVGGFPVVHRRRDFEAQRRWLTGYSVSLAERDVADVAATRLPRAMPRLLTVLAHRTASVYNAAQIARDADLNNATASAYTAALQRVHAISFLPAWSTRSTDLDTKHPKLHLVDCGVAAALMHTDHVPTDTAVAGRLLETMVVNEISRQSSWGEADCSLFHYRYRDRHEVDLIVEVPDGRIIAVEVKSGVHTTSADFSGIEFLRQRAGDRFLAGYVMHTGTSSRRHGDRMFALPIDRLWTVG